MSKKRGVAKRIKKTKSFYKIQNENDEFISIVGQVPRINWVTTRYLADAFSFLKIEWLKEFFPDLNFQKLKLIEVDENEIEEDKEKYLKIRS